MLSRQPDRPEAIAPLIRLERTKGRDEEALRLAKKLIEVATDEGQRADALAEIAQLEIARGDAAAAAQAAAAAIGMHGPGSAAARIYRQLVERVPDHASWDAYASALATHLEKHAPSTDARSATYRELARIFAGPLNRPDRAIATLREGVEACPGDAKLALALVDALVTVSAHDKALGELRRLLASDVRVPQAWRALASLTRSLNEPDGAAVAMAPLVALGQADEQETRTVGGRRPRPAEAPAGILGEAGLKQLVDDNPLESSAAVLTHALSDVIVKLEGVDYEALGVTKRDRIRAGEPHAVRALVDRIGTIFGIPEVDLFIVPSGLEHASIAPGSPPALLVPAAIESAPDAKLVFELARPLALLSRHLHALDAIPPEHLTRILVGAARQYEPTFSFGPEDDELDADTKRVGKAIPWLQRGRIQDAATTFAASPPEDLPAWVASVHRLAERAALLVADDLLSALDALGVTIGTDETATELALFWVSDPAMRFRRAVAQQL